jgi:hypothetical protein
MSVEIQAVDLLEGAFHDSRLGYFLLFLIT